MEKTHMHGAKESHNSIHGMKPSNAHSRVRQSLTKQNCLKKHHLEKHCHTPQTLLTSQPLWNEVSIAVQAEWLVDPALQQGVRNKQKPILTLLIANHQLSQQEASLYGTM